VESFNANTDFGGTYYGFQNILFDTVRINANGGGDILDDLQSTTANLPEPASLAQDNTTSVTAGKGFAQLAMIEGSHSAANL
jgi:hypothetical protein